MKTLYYSFISFFLLFSCTKDIHRGDSEDHPNDLSISLGNFRIAESTLSALPYPERTFFTLKNAAGEEFTFFMNQPAYSSEFAYLRAFAHPSDPEKNVTYEFSGDRYEFEFVNQVLGAILEVVINPNLCTNPNLATEGVISDHIWINSRGFLAPEFNYPNPVFDLSIPGKTLCKPGKDATRYFPTLTLMDQEFEGVYYSKVSRDNFTFEVFYTEALGIVAIRNKGELLVLDQ